MKTKIRIIVAILGVILLMSACGHDAQPPRTNDSDSNFILPSGSLPTQEELDELNEIRTEYNNSIK